MTKLDEAADIWIAKRTVAVLKGEVKEHGSKLAFKAGAKYMLTEDETIKALVEALKVSMRNAQEHFEGCLYCGAPLNRVYDADEKVTTEHQAECWYYKALNVLALYDAKQKELTGEK